ncbi:MAG: hypothetical protein IPJ41_04425 [Phycisphaerales bacterium]|nr:hypothetical protein [Phycisphaerales bacterium]
MFYYEMDVEVNGKTIEVAAFATGDIEDRLVGDEESDGEHASGGDEDGEKARGGAKHEGDRKTRRRRLNLGASGPAPD